MSLPWGGGYVLLFEICEKGPFQKCMGWGGRRWSQFCAQSCTREDTQGTGKCSRDHILFRIRFTVIAAPFQKGRDSIGAHIPLLVTGNILFQFFPILQLACLHWHLPCVQLMV